MKPFSAIASLLMAIVAIVQLTRYFEGWPVMINDTAIPLWPSAVAGVVLGILSIMVWREAKR